MHVCIWHGYLLSGTGSNIYVRNLASHAVAIGGHEVSLVCQETSPQNFDFVDCAYDLTDDNGSTVPIFERRPPSQASCRLYRPNLGGHLPVYVFDRYERFPRVTEMPSLEDADLDDYIDRNVAALRTIFAETPPDLVITNHAVLSPCLVRRAFGETAPRVCVIHGSALNYSVRKDERLHRLAVEGLDGARCVIVVSEGSGEALLEVLGTSLSTLSSLVTVVPCGVDTKLFRIETAEVAVEGLTQALTGPFGLSCAHEADFEPRLASTTSEPEMLSAVEEVRGTYNERQPDEGALDKILALEPQRPGLITFAGKLILSKGPQAILLALPHVFARTSARALFVGFGTLREAMVILLHAIGRGDVAAVRTWASLGPSLEGGQRGGCPEMMSFLADLEERDELENWVEAARGCHLADRVRFTGILGHTALCHVLALSSVTVVPSIFPEAFGMVGVEAMACGTLPLLTRQGGLADLLDLLGEAIDPALPQVTAINPEPSSMVADLAEKLVASLNLVSSRPDLAERLAEFAASRYGWGSVSERIIGAGGA